jgi:allantoate deiminase
MNVLDCVSTDIMDRLDRLAEISESEHHLTRRVYTSEHRRAANLIASWMREAGMEVREDAFGNVIGRYEGRDPGAPIIMLGSHHDSVIMGGKYDGPLGILSAIDAVRSLHARELRTENPVEVVAFADEEGVRYQSTLLGSRGMAGTFDLGLLTRTDKDGISLAKAMIDYGLDPDMIPAAARPKGDLLCYLELHIEQGPVLENEDLAVSAVTAISGADRMSVTVLGKAGHAGTVPMNSREDALVAAAECVLAVEDVARAYDDAVATVGDLTVVPGATNVIPGHVVFSVDLRAPKDEVLRQAMAALSARFDKIAERRDVSITPDHTYMLDSVTAAPWIVDTIETAMVELGHPKRRLPSGAGHDAGAMAEIADVGMIFVRCEGGISHNPAENITEADAIAGVQVLLRTIEKIGGLNQ